MFFRRANGNFWVQYYSLKLSISNGFGFGSAVRKFATFVLLLAKKSGNLVNFLRVEHKPLEIEIYLSKTMLNNIFLHPHPSLSLYCCLILHQ